MLSNPVFDLLGEKLFLLAPDSTVLDLTGPARAMLTCRTVLRLERGRLTCLSARNTARLQKLIAKLALEPNGMGAASLALQRGDEAQPALATLTALVGWWPEHDLASANVVLAQIAEPDTCMPIRLRDLQALFGLTPAEARVACATLDGCGLSAVAQRLGIRVTTARTHLQHVFEKTGTTRQSKLVRLLLSYGPLPGDLDDLWRDIDPTVAGTQPSLADGTRRR